MYAGIFDILWGRVIRTNGLTGREFMIMFMISLLVIPIDFMRKLILKKLNRPLGV